MFSYEIYQFYESATVADPDLQIRGGGGVSPRNFFRLFMASFGLKIRGDPGLPGLPGPSPGSATVVSINPLSSKVHIHIL